MPLLLQRCYCCLHIITDRKWCWKLLHLICHQAIYNIPKYGNTSHSQQPNENDHSKLQREKINPAYIHKHKTNSDPTQNTNINYASTIMSLAPHSSLNLPKHKLNQNFPCLPLPILKSNQILPKSRMRWV